MRYLVHLLIKHLRQYPGRSLTALFVLMIASILMLSLAGAGAALRFRVGNYLGTIFPEEQLWLQPMHSTIGPIALEPKPITDGTIAAIAARPEVAQVYAIEPLRLPVAVSGNLFGNEISSDAVIHGVPRELVADALLPGQAWGRPANPDGPYPLVVSRYFIDLYNLGMARASGLPLLSEKSIIGRHMTIHLGQSSVLPMPPNAHTRDVSGVIVGFTSQPGLLALEMPDEVVRAFNKEFVTNMQPEYIKLSVRLKKGEDRDEVLKAAASQGMTLPGSDILGGQIKRSVRVAGWTLMGLALGVFALGMLTFYTLFTMIFHARRLDLVRLRALGLSPAEVVALALGEVGAIALCAVGLATGVVALLSGWAAGRLQTMASQTSMLPKELFQISLGWLMVAGAVILVVTIIPALPVLRWIVKVEPASVIRDL